MRKTGAAEGERDRVGEEFAVTKKQSGDQRSLCVVMLCHKMGTESCIKGAKPRVETEAAQRAVTDKLLCRHTPGDPFTVIVGVACIVGVKISGDC